ncbi:hypothetical protein [Solirubrobacter pauli]|uniref:hypothetical protein n=1 Tax=Solirubrobacter pauli TaxID=166793 RepID=UPI0011C49AE5|nr:hypothetical protein [Solirubrobacter pauli]
MAGVANACQVVAQIPEDPEAQPTIVASGVANLLLSDTTLYIGFGGPGACESQSKVITGFGLVDLYPRAFCCAWPLNEIDRIERAGRRLTLHHDSPAAAFLADDVSAADEEWRHSVRGKLDEFHTAVTAAMAGAR